MGWRAYVVRNLPRGGERKAVIRPVAASLLRSDDAERLTATLRGVAPPDVAWQAWYESRRAAVEAALERFTAAVRQECGPYSRLGDAVGYSLRSGGKRIRPVLVLECAELCGGNAAAALTSAVALECLHAFSLIHDDLPAMDNDDLRRGEPTCHRVFGEALAILAGDYLQAAALRLPLDPPPRAAERVAVLAAASQAMIAGQAADIAGEGRPPEAALVEYIHKNKTAALLEAACRLGALSSDAPDEHIERMSCYGRHLGLAFQIADDLLDATGSEAAAGKRVGKDAGVAKQTYPAVFGLEESRRRAEAEVALAQSALDEWGARAAPLRALAQYVILRDR